MYDAETGRFLQRDPVWDPGNVGNQYTFCGNNSANCMDPMGTDASDRPYWAEDRGFYRWWARQKAWLTGPDRPTKSAEDFFFSKDVADVGASSAPVLGDAKDIQEVVSGKNLVTGRNLTSGERLVTVGAAILPLVGGAVVRRLAKRLRMIADSPLAEAVEAPAKKTVASAFGKPGKFFNGPADADEAWSVFSKAKKKCPNNPKTDKIYRSGAAGKPKDFQLREGEEALSFRSSLSNSVPEAGNMPKPTFRDGAKYVEVDVNKLPAGSVDFDGGKSVMNSTTKKTTKMPDGHVSVKATYEDIMKATVRSDKIKKFNKAYKQELKSKGLR